MDPRDTSPRPSIFSAPDPTEVRDAIPRSRTAPRPDRPYPRRPADPPVGGPSGPDRRLLIGVGVAGVLVLLLGGFVVGSMLGRGAGAAVQSGTPSPDVTPAVTSSPTAVPTPTATPEPTPIPTPAGPPQEVAVGAWATVVVDELTVHDTASDDSASNYSLVRGAVVRVSESAVVASLNWYRIASLGGAVGWASSGWTVEPYLTTLVEDPTLIRCGKVQRPVFDVVSGRPTPHDPIAIGDLALPAAAFSELSMGAFELLRGVGEDACFSAQVGSDGVPRVSSQLVVTACGHAEADGDFYRLRPATGLNVPPEAQVKDPAIVHPEVLVGGAPESRRSSNLRTIVGMMANPDQTGCIHLSVTEDADDVESYRTVDTTQCSVVHEYNADNLRLSPAAGGAEAWIKLSPGQSQPGIFELEVPMPVTVSAVARPDGTDAWAYQAYDPDCE